MECFNTDNTQVQLTMHSCWIYDTIAADAEMKRLLEYRADSLLDVILLLEKLAAR